MLALGEVDFHLLPFGEIRFDPRGTGDFEPLVADPESFAVLSHRGDVTRSDVPVGTVSGRFFDRGMIVGLGIFRFAAVCGFIGIDLVVDVCLGGVLLVGFVLGARDELFNKPFERVRQEFPQLGFCDVDDFFFFHDPSP